MGEEDTLSVFPFEVDLPEPELSLTSILRDKEQVKCSTCDKSYSSKRSLVRHINAIHRSETGRKTKADFEKTWCELCQRYVRRSFIRFHLNRCHVDETCSQRLMEIVKLLRTFDAVQKFYKCADCDKMYDNYSSFKAHKYLHAGKFQCGICDKAMSSATALKIHRRVHKIFDATKNMEGNEKYVLCQKCRKYVDKKRLNFHDQTVHSEKMNLRPICTFCGKEFQTKAVRPHIDLQRRTKTHFFCSSSFP